MKKLIVIATVLVFAASCSDDFLFQPPRAALTVGSFPANADDAVLAINGAYNILRTWQINTGGFPLFDLMADDAVKGSNPGDGTAVAVYDKFTHTALEGGIEAWYKTEYEAIRRTNLVINEVPNIDMEENLKTRIIAEARFLRAFFYADLVRGFGAVPMVTVIDAPIDLGRTSVETILNEVIYPDLENAIANLPVRSDYGPEDLGRATKGAAQGLLARVKLFYGDFAAVEQLTKEVINSNEYQLMDDYAEVFPAANENNAESVFEIAAKPESFAEGGNQFANTQGVRGTPNRGWGFCRPSYTLIDEMQENNDPRLDPSVIFLNEVLDGITITGDGATPDTTRENGQIVEIECYNQKVWYPGTDTRTSFGHNRRIIRYADIILMHAEALNENGKSAEALTFLNQIRERARGDQETLPDYTTTNKDELRTLILEERKYEFAIEGLRFWDLVRTDRAEAILGPLGFIKGKNELFPIPQSEVDISQGRITQNPGY
ncbi:RagB/SusD family nutrient uptake outer membrane protein [Portibacter lacus]|uniref:Membrane protein n=1 Tax=Portibacter lacus TaxID=1099794 RepID=A0AA37SNR4_9BACT|nr:RagB/SusD family nutrient uptake outer membrane protein [Portibacter lacus]GLR18076.1 membrane protein [Portibacter lacus]